MENAAQHARPDTAVTLRVSEPGPSWIRTSVHNVGEPISPANLTRVWDRFFTTRSSQGGTGLGLAIVASVVKQLHGTVAVTSSPEEGTTFSFDLPGSGSVQPALGLQCRS